MASIMDFFKVMLIVQLFYAFSITSLTYAMPDDSINYVTSFSDLSSQINLEEVSGQVQESLESQTNIPLIELGALVFYSGNILIDLLLNFAFAVPEMASMVINGVMVLFSVDSYLIASLQLFASVVVMVIYFLGIIQLIMGIRSGNINVT